MPRLNRRNTLIGLATIVFGASGFVASGAFQIGSTGSRGSEWIQVQGVNRAVDVAEPGEDLDVGDDNEGGDDDDDGGTPSDEQETPSEDEDDDDDEEDTPSDEEQTSTPSPEPTTAPTPTATPTPTLSPTPTPTLTPTATPTPSPTPAPPGDTGGGTPVNTPSPTPTATPEPDSQTLVQVVTDPDNDGNYLNGSSQLQWNGQMAASETIEGDANGLFERFSVSNANRNAISRVGLVDENGYPEDRIAFLVVNVGDIDTPGTGGGPVDFGLALFDDQGKQMANTEQLNFPYRVTSSEGNKTKRGRDLHREEIRLPVGHIIEVVIEVDSRTGTDEVSEVSTLLFTAQGASR